MGLSSRHHYLPRFYIKGFANQNGLLWVYDKQKDQIFDRQRSPKSIFFEEDLNIISVDAQLTDLLETMLAKIDTYFAKPFLKICDETNIDSVNSMENYVYLDILVQQLFWRTTNSIDKKNALLDFYKSIEGDWRSFKIEKLFDFLTEEDKQLILRTVIPYDILDNQKLLPKYRYAQIVVFKKPSFFISDNPIIFKNTPLQNEDFIPFAFAINRNRVYLSLESANWNFSGREILVHNLLLIHQTVRYVCYHSKETLEQLVALYKDTIALNPHAMAKIKETFFEEIGKRASSI